MISVKIGSGDQNKINFNIMYDYTSSFPGILRTSKCWLPIHLWQLKENFITQVINSFVVWVLNTEAFFRKLEYYQNRMIAKTVKAILASK